jgi:hypothetical protein
LLQNSIRQSSYEVIGFEASFEEQIARKSPLLRGVRKALQKDMVLKSRLPYM